MNDSRLIAIDAIMNNQIVTIEFLRCMLGDLLGEGRDRYVFQSLTNSKEVIKIDMSNHNSNVIEWSVWGDITGMPEVAKWFAPVLRMPACGRVLVMRKVDMDRPADDYPKLIPSFFGDVKYSNFGFIGKQLVCVDYAINTLNIKGAKIKMIKSPWQ